MGIFAFQQTVFKQSRLRNKENDPRNFYNKNNKTMEGYLDVLNIKNFINKLNNNKGL